MIYFESVIIRIRITVTPAIPQSLKSIILFVFSSFSLSLTNNTHTAMTSNIYKVKFREITVNASELFVKNTDSSTPASNSILN
jgi:hypothetical protein